MVNALPALKKFATAVPVGTNVENGVAEATTQEDGPKLSCSTHSTWSIKWKRSSARVSSARRYTCQR